MQDLDEFTVTHAALAQMANTSDPRLLQIMEAAVRHLHAFAREINLTPAEWLDGIRFFTRVGHACTPVRQEFILLSDVLGLSAVVNALHDKTAHDTGTQSSLLGPFYREGAPEFALGDCIVAHPGAPEILLHGQVTDSGGTPIAGAIIQVWQTDAKGHYDLQAHNHDQMDMRGNFTCNAQGHYHFRTVRPLGYAIPLDGPVGALIHQQNRHGMRPAHIHFLIAAPGFRELVTALYFGDDENIASDTVFGVSNSLVVQSVLSDGEAPIPGLPSIRYDFQLGHADAAGDGRVGADPARLVRAGEQAGCV